MSHLGTVGTLIYAGASSGAQSITVGMTVPVGSSVVGALVWDSADGTVPSITSIVDTKGNTYVTDQQVSGQTTVAILGFRGRISNALASGDTITITIGTTRIRWVGRVEAFSDILQAHAISPLDVSSNRGSTSGTLLESGTTAQTSQDKVLAFVAYGLGVGRTYTAPAGWTEQPAVETANGTNDRAVKVLFKYIDTIGTQSANTTISPSGTNVGIIMTYRVATGNNNYPQTEHRFEGLADATAITTTNSGDAAGDAFNLVNGTTVADDAVVGRGTRSALHSVSAASTAGGRDTTNIGATRVIRGSMLFSYTTAPGANMGAFTILSGASAAVRLQITTGRVARLVDSTFTQMAASGATLMPLNQMMRIEWRAVASTTVGQARVRIWFNPASTGTPDIDLNSTASFNTLAFFDGYDTGIQFSASQTYSGVTVDEVYWTADDSADIGVPADPRVLTYDFEGATPLANVDATGNAVVTTSAVHSGTKGVRLNSQTVPGFLKVSNLTFGSGKRWASIAAWMRQPSGSLTANCNLVRFRNTDPSAVGTGGNGDIWIDYTNGFIKGDLLGAYAVPGTGNVTTTTSSSATGLTGNKPANVQDGDLLWALFYHRNAAGTISAPAGWTIRKTEAGNGTFAFATKPIPSASGETATTYAFSNNQGAGRCTLQIGRIIGADLSSPVDVVGTTSVFTGTTSLVHPSITASIAKTLLLAVSTNNESSATPSLFSPAATMAEVSEVSVTSASTSSTAALSQEFLGSSGATGTRTSTISAAADNSAGFLINIKPKTIVGSTNLGSGWFYLQAVCAFKADGLSFLKFKVDGTEVGTLHSALPVLGEALAHVALGSRVATDAIVDVDSFELQVSDSTLDYIGDPGLTPAPYIRSGGSWVAGTAYVLSGGSWVVATPHVRSGGSWVASG